MAPRIHRGDAKGDEVRAGCVGMLAGPEGEALEHALRLRGQNGEIARGDGAGGIGCRSGAGRSSGRGGGAGRDSGAGCRSGAGRGGGAGCGGGA